jgi:sulfite dehydrogenase (cytochrome) subunit B
MKKSIVLIMAVLTAAGMIVLSGERDASGGGTAVRTITLPAVQTSLKPGDDLVTVETYCNICHSTEYIPMQPPLTRAQWQASVNKMIKAFGAPISEADADKITRYLAAQYGTGK